MQLRAKTLQKSCITWKKRYFWHIHWIKPSSSGCLALNIHLAGELQTRKQFGEPNYPGGVQEHEDARTSHPCERRARDHKANLKHAVAGSANLPRGSISSSTEVCDVQRRASKGGAMRRQFQRVPGGRRRRTERARKKNQAPRDCGFDFLPKHGFSSICDCAIVCEARGTDGKNCGASSAVRPSRSAAAHGGNPTKSDPRSVARFLSAKQRSRPNPNSR